MNTLNPLPASVVVTATAGRAYVPGSRWAPLGGGRPALLRHHRRRSLPLSAAKPSPSACGGVRAGLHTPARYELAPASATWPSTARASQRGAVSGQPGLRPGGENATDGVTGSQTWIGCGQ